MNKLHFRAWLHNENKMVEVADISIERDEIGYYNEEGDYEEYIIAECDLMQGIEINGQVVYGGDVVEFNNDKNKRIIIGSMRHLLDVKERIIINDLDFKVIDNIYENEELLWEQH